MRATTIAIYSPTIDGTNETGIILHERTDRKYRLNIFIRGFIFEKIEFADFFSTREFG